MKKQDSHHPYSLATRPQRFYNYLIDIGVSIVLVNLLHLDILFSDEFLIFFPEILYDGMFQVYILMVGFTEFIFKGKSPGKMLTKTIALKSNYEPMSKTDIFIRTITRLIPFEFLSYLLPDDFKTGWHDKLSKTIVIQENKVEQEKNSIIDDIGIKQEEEII